MDIAPKCYKCRRTPYYSVFGKPACGYHAGKNKHKLLSDPNKAIMAKENEFKRWELLLRDTSARVMTRKIYMMKPYPFVDGSYLVLPKRSAPIRDKSILPYSQLSPMMLGPVEHNQPGLPPSQNLENFHQFNKVFDSEVIEGTITSDWYDRRIKGYNDVIPHRYKLGPTKREHNMRAGNCLFSIYVDPDGNELHYNYIGSRVFYCTWYERLASQTEQYKDLLDMVSNYKISITIAGYDARDADVITSDLAMEWYLDDTKPFGHEMVLATMIALRDTPELYPWRIVASMMPYEI